MTCPCGQISVVRLALDVGVEDWEGRHEEPDLIGADAGKPATIVDALVLCRTSH